jgi:hypothetical protein
MEKRMKILKTAIFTDYSEAPMKFPSCLISEMKFNPDGEILFSIKSASEDMNGFDPEFPGHMCFFNEDFDFYIKADGMALVTAEDEGLGIRFRILRARYFYSAKLESRGMIRLFYNFMELLFVPKMSERLYDYHA